MDFLVLEDFLVFRFLGKTNVLNFFFSYLLSKQDVTLKKNCASNIPCMISIFFFFEEISEVDLIRAWMIEDDRLNSGLIPEKSPLFSANRNYIVLSIQI